MALRDSLRRPVGDVGALTLGLDVTNGAAGSAPMVDAGKSPIVWLNLSQIMDNPYQPRGHYDAAHVAGLATSIASLKHELPSTLGLQQVPLARAGKWDNAGEFDAAPRALYSDPVQLRRFLAEKNACVQLMFGHSRLRAFMLLAEGPRAVWNMVPKLEDDLVWPEPDPAYLHMPVMLGFALDIAMWQHAITENSQRKNITAIEEAKTLQRAVDEFGLTLEEAGKPFGYVNRGTVSNKLRLLRLPATVQTAVATGEITERHARELLQLEADPDKLIEMHEKQRKSGWTVAVLADQVKYEARQMKERLERQRQLREVAVTLQAGWTPPGWAEPLPADRVHTKNSWINVFNTNDKIDKALLTTGLCNADCACCVVGYTSAPPDGAIQPDPTQAPGVYLACNGGWEARNAKVKVLKVDRAYAIQPTDADRARAAEEARREAAAAEVNAVAFQRWVEGLANIDLDALLMNLNFWRIATEGGTWEMKAEAHQATSMADFRDRILDRLFHSTATWTAEYSGRVNDIAKVDKLLAALSMAAIEAEEETETIPVL